MVNAWRFFWRSFVGIAILIRLVACGAPDFDSVAKIESVRILATSADKPYAKPGDTVTLTALAVDGRTDQSRAMHVYWLPFACNNPREDLYYACFASFLGGASADAGATPDGGSPSPHFQPGVDITSFLHDGPTYSLTLPNDLISSHPMVDGAPRPYGLSITFFMACAGHVQLVPIDPNNVSGQVLPVGCFDDNGKALGADDFVFSFTRVYAFADLTNANPHIGIPAPGGATETQVLFDGNPVDVAQGVTVDHCTPNIQCSHAVNVQVPDSSWEINPDDPGQDGTLRHEQVYASYFFSVGSTKSTGRILFDPVVGKIADSANEFESPSDPGSGQLWIVVHDNRDGAAWVHFPITVK